jgi:hypothetical protein
MCPVPLKTYRGAANLFYSALGILAHRLGNAGLTCGPSSPIPLHSSGVTAVLFPSERSSWLPFCANALAWGAPFLPAPLRWWQGAMAERGGEAGLALPVLGKAGACVCAHGGARLTEKQSPELLATIAQLRRGQRKIRGVSGEPAAGEGRGE